MILFLFRLECLALPHLLYLKLLLLLLVFLVLPCIARAWRGNVLRGRKIPCMDCRGPVLARSFGGRAGGFVVRTTSFGGRTSGFVVRTRSLGVRTPLQPYPTTALGASEVNLLELATAYRTIASGILAEPHAIRRVARESGDALGRGERRAARSPSRTATSSSPAR